MLAVTRPRLRKMPSRINGSFTVRSIARETALRHPRLNEFWQVSDFILENDPLVRAHIYGG